jgi:hypothetical protein
MCLSEKIQENCSKRFNDRFMGDVQANLMTCSNFRYSLNRTLYSLSGEGYKMWISFRCEKII